MARYASIILLTVFLSVTAFAAGSGLDSGSCTDAQQAQVTTSHLIQLHGKLISYSTTTGFLEVTANDKSSKACIFYTSYVVKPEAGAPERPITFAFNGGPGSASLWLHLGIMGPKRVDMGPDGLSAPNALGLVLNESTPLDVTDIVMIDPVATGFSHTENGAQNDKFFGVKNDYTSIAAFIENFINNYSRWGAPKFVMGESYGGIRGSLLAHHLQNDYGIGLAGVILVSPALSDTTFFGAPDNNVPYWTFLPSFATTAWFHKKIAQRYQSMDVASVYEEAKHFGISRYRNALEQGNQVDPREFDAVASQLADFTGLALDEIKESGLKITDDDIFSGMLGSESHSVGRYDSRFVGQIFKDNSGTHYTDPSDDMTNLPFTAAINEYLRDELGFHFISPYTTQADIQKWPNNDELFGSSLDVTSDLVQALAQNPHLRIMIASGYFDLACPMGTVEYELSQMPDGKKFSSRVEQKKYFGGHMMYINPAVLVQLKADMADFIQAQTKYTHGHN